MSATHGERDALDRYDTPAWPVDRLFDYLRRHELLDFDAKVRLPWLEAAVGSGAIVLAVEAWLRRNGFVVPTFECYDLRPRGDFAHNGRAKRLNFLTSKQLVLPRNFVSIGNPPYKHAFRFVSKGFGQTNLSMQLLRLSWYEGATKVEPARAAFLRKYPPDVFVLPERPTYLRNGRPMRNRRTGKKITGSDSSVYAWFVWGLTYDPHRRGSVGGLHLLDETPVTERRRRAA